jgi:23S rRNA pseudouridine1911/1915/1917 synthase
MNNLVPTILFENDDLLVINKPAGLVVHPDGKREGESLVDWILNNYPEMSGVGEPLVMEHKGETVTVDRPGIVHRLDRETSGVLILAKTQNAYEHFKKTIPRSFHSQRISRDCVR